METSVQTGARLLAALEELWAQEATLLQAREFTGACAVLERAAPLVQQVCRLAAEPGMASLRPEVAALLTRREKNRLILEEQIAQMRRQMRQIEEARHRLARVAPAYGGTARTVTRLHTAA
jgi:hypothetical protein